MMAGTAILPTTIGTKSRKVTQRWPNAATDLRIPKLQIQATVESIAGSPRPKAGAIDEMSTNLGAIRFVNIKDGKNVFAVKLQIHQNLQLDQGAVS